MSEELFYVDDFFATDDDPGVTVAVNIRGRQVPITFKRGLTIEDKAKAQQMAIKRRITPDGKVIVEGLDETEAVVYMLAVSIKEWPFTDRATGEKFPITPENIKKLLGGADEMADVIAKLDAEGAEALVPFVARSTED